MALTKRERARYRAIIRELSRLSARGWDRATYPDYAPLEAELQVLVGKLIDASNGREHRRLQAPMD